MDALMLALSLSAALHMAAFVGMVAYSKYFGAKVRFNFKQESYVVHLIDPGPVAGETGFGRSSVVDAIPQEAPALKKVAPIEKKLLPATKDGAEVKKVTLVKKTAVEKKVVADAGTTPSKTKKKLTALEAKKAESVAKEIREKKGGGTIDIRKFPYEWYLRIMESRIFVNWDILKVNYFTDRPIKVSVFFSIDTKGNISKIELEQSSLNENIDRSALEAVRKSAPFPPLPPGYKDNSLDVHFGFTLNPER